MHRNRCTHKHTHTHTIPLSVLIVTYALRVHKAGAGVYVPFVNGFVPGQVLTKENIQDVIRFAKEKNLLLMADEVSVIALCFGSCLFFWGSCSGLWLQRCVVKGTNVCDYKGLLWLQKLVITKACCDYKGLLWLQWLVITKACCDYKGLWFQRLGVITEACCDYSGFLWLQCLVITKACCGYKGLLWLQRVSVEK